MGKIKGWEKTRNIPNKFIQYDNEVGNNTIYIKHNEFFAYHKKIDDWQVFDFRNKMKKIHLFKTKKEVLAYAKAYMRANPNG